MRGTGHVLRNLALLGAFSKLGKTRENSQIGDSDYFLKNAPVCRKKHFEIIRENMFETYLRISLFVRQFTFLSTHVGMVKV